MTPIGSQMSTTTQQPKDIFPLKVPKWKTVNNLPLLPPPPPLLSLSFLNFSPEHSPSPCPASVSVLCLQGARADRWFRLCLTRRWAWGQVLSYFPSHFQLLSPSSCSKWSISPHFSFVPPLKALCLSCSPLHLPLIAHCLLYGRCTVDVC